MSLFEELKNESDNEFTDISSEIYRSYVFENGQQVRIDYPVALSVSASGGHRVLDAKGISHYIPPKWIHLYWEVMKDAPNFVK